MKKTSKVAKKAWKTRKGYDIINLLCKVWKKIHKDYKKGLINNESDLHCNIYFWLRKYFKGYDIKSEWCGKNIRKGKGEISKGWIDIIVSKGEKNLIAIELKFKDKRIHPYSRNITNDLNKLKRLRYKLGFKFGVIAFIAKKPPYFDGTRGYTGGLYYSKRNNNFFPKVKKKPKKGFIEWIEENKTRKLIGKGETSKEKYRNAKKKLWKVIEKFNEDSNINRILSRDNLYLIRWDTSRKRIKSHWQRNYYLEMQGWSDNKHWKVVNF